MTADSKVYTKVIRRSGNEYKHNFKNNIRNMRSKSPKMNWQFTISLGKLKRHLDLDNML